MKAICPSHMAFNKENLLGQNEWRLDTDKKASRIHSFMSAGHYKIMDEDN